MDLFRRMKAHLAAQNWLRVTDVGIVAAAFIVFNQYWTIHEHLVFVCLLLVAASRFLSIEPRLFVKSSSSFPMYFYLGFLAWILISSAWSPTLHMSFSYALLAGLAGIAALLLGAALNLRTIASGISLAVIGVALHIYVTGGFSLSAWGLYTNPSSLSFVLGLAAIFILFDRSASPRSWISGVVLIIVTCSWLFALDILTALFALFGASFVGIVLLHIRNSRPSTKRILGIAYLTLFISVVLVFWFFREPILRPLGEDPTLSSRTPLWEAYFEAVLWRPWVGSGWGSTVGWDFPLDKDLLIPVVEWFPAHNGFIDIALMLGFVGLFLFLGAWASLLWTSLRFATSKAFSWRFIMIPTLIAYLTLNDVMATSLPKFIGVFLTGLMVGRVAAMPSKSDVSRNQLIREA
jgi:exopolysaccharide production protein ExoQ